MSSTWKPLYEKSNPQTLVENRITFQTDEVELNLYETKTSAFEFPLAFQDFSLISMLEGKKVMHFDKGNSFEFMPSESLLLDKYQAMEIDFPEANVETPTRCMALLISDDQINTTLNLLNNHAERIDKTDWHLSAAAIKFTNDDNIKSSLDRIINLASSAHPYRKSLGKIATQELIIHLLQNQSHTQLLHQSKTHATSHPIAFAIAYIRDHIEDPINLDVVAQKAYLSKSSFFRHFKQEMGMSPYEFVLAEKIKRAQSLLQTLSISVAEVAYQLSFNSVSHFVQLFKKMAGVTPHRFRKRN